MPKRYEVVVISKKKEWSEKTNKQKKDKRKKERRKKKDVFWNVGLTACADVSCFSQCVREAAVNT